MGNFLRNIWKMFWKNPWKNFLGNFKNNVQRNLWQHLFNSSRMPGISVEGVTEDISEGMRGRSSCGIPGMISYGYHGRFVKGICKWFSKESRDGISIVFSEKKKLWRNFVWNLRSNPWIFLKIHSKHFRRNFGLFCKNLSVNFRWSPCKLFKRNPWNYFLKSIKGFLNEFFQNFLVKSLEMSLENPVRASYVVKFSKKSFKTCS